MNTCVIVLGSNIFPQNNIPLAQKLLSEQFEILAQSEPRKTKPVGIIDQEDFVNGGLLLQTEFTQEKLRIQLKKVEFRMGRTSTPLKSDGPRLIDVDMIVWNNTVVDSDFYGRAFVRQLVFELLPLVRY